MSARGIPVQDLPENQDPSVAYMLDEMTGARTPLVEKGVEEEKPKSRRGRKKAAAKPAEDETETADESDDSASETDAKEKSSDISSVREVGS